MVRRRKWIIIQIAVVVTFAAVAFSLHQQVRYRATSAVLLSHQNLAASLTGASQSSDAVVQADRDAETQAVLASVPLVAERTLKALGLSRTASDLLANSSVTAESNADILRFAVTDADPLIARRLATEYARQFTRYRAQLDTRPIQLARAGVIKKITELEASQQTRGALYANLENRSQQLESMQALQTSNATLVRTPDAAPRVQPRPIRNTALGLAIGLVLGLAAALVWEALDTRVRSVAEIEERLEMPVIARLSAPARRLRATSRLVALVAPRDRQVESFEMLRRNLEFVLHDVPSRTVLITSCVQEEGKSTSVGNLAVVLARAGERVALVDLDLRRPSLHKFFDVELGTAGVAHVVIGAAALDDALIPIELDRGASQQSRSHGELQLLVAGHTPPNVAHVLESRALELILVQLQSRFDTVLIDAPPALKVVDALTLSAKVDSMLVVARANVIRRPMLNDLHRVLSTASAKKLGIILTDAGVSDDHNHGTYYGYGYGNSGEVPSESFFGPAEGLTST